MATIFLLMVAVILTVANGNDPKKVMVYADFDNTTNRFQIHEGYPRENSLAWATFINTINENGWGLLEVQTAFYYSSGNYNDSMASYAAGLVEGYITRDLIRQHWRNTRAGYCDQPLSPYCHRLRDFLQTNLDWVRAAIKNNQDDPYWHQVEMFYTQLRGISDGYNNDPQLPSLDIDPLGLYMMQISDDLEDLEVALGKPGIKKGPKSGHCSAIVKFDQYQQLLVAHNTWSGYDTMLRILKRYSLPYGRTNANQGESTLGNCWTFSSYPGYLVSSDDFHVLSSRMVTMETTIPNNNPDLYVHTKPKGCLFEPVRVWAANRLATGGTDWVRNFTRYNSGTYNNQWMIVNFKLIGEDRLYNGVLTVLEQMPGYIEHADVTDFLRSETYWASYNVAYFPKIFNMSGQQKLVDKYGDYFTHDMCRRAQIFRRDHNKVKDKATLFQLMSYNDFEHDPLSRCNCTDSYSAKLAIAARGDLNSESGSYPFNDLGFEMGGAIDVKMISYNDIFWMLFDAISGPTYQQQPPFQWSKVKDESKYRHSGQPDLFHFKPISFNGTQIPPYTPSWFNGH